METTNRISVDIFKNISESVPLPFIIIDNRGMVLTANSSADKLLAINSKNQNFFELFSKNMLEKFDTLLDDASKNDISVREIVNVTLASEKMLKLEMLINPYVDEQNEKFLFISFNPKFVEDSKDKELRLTVSDKELSEIVNNSKIISIINEIKSGFPFTFLTKGKIQNEINNLSEFFWMKDANQKYILVNNSFSKLIGLKPSQVEGKLETAFIPNYFWNFYTAVNKYLEDSLQYVVLEGLPLKGFANFGSYQTIEFPLSDAENNLLAVIGIGQPKSFNEGMGKIFELPFISELTDSFNGAIAVFDSSGKLIQSNLAFKSLFKAKITGTAVTYFYNIFAEEISHQFEKFKLSDASETLTNIEIIDDEGIQSVALRLKRLIANSEKIYLIQIESELDYNNIEYFVKKKGKMFDLLIQRNPQPIFVYDAENLRFLEVNDAALKLYRYSREEFLQMDLTDLYTPEDIQTLLDSESRTAEGEFSGPYKHKAKDGDVMFVELSKTHFQFEGKEAHFNIVKDVSDVVEKEKQFNLYKSAFESTSDLVFVTDSTGFIKFVNNAGTKELNYSRSDLIDSSFISYIPDSDRGEVNTKIFLSQKEEAKKIDVKLKRKDGSLLSLELSAKPILDFDGELDTFILIAKAPSQIKEVEKEIIKEVVKEVVIEKKIPVTASVGASGKLDTTQLSNIFHEILTPINVILGFIQEIRDGLDNPTPEQSEAIDFITQNREKLLDIMNSIADFAQVEKEVDNVEILPRSLQSIIASVESDYKSLRETWRKKFELVHTEDITISADESKLNKLFSIALMMASKITQENTLFVSTEQYSPTHFQFAIKDNLSVITDRLNDSFSSLLKETDDVKGKDFGISRFSVKALRSLVDSCKGYFVPLEKGGKKIGVAFRFPIFVDVEEENIPEEKPITEVVAQPFEKEAARLPEVEEKFEEVIQPEVEQTPQQIAQQIFEERAPELKIEPKTASIPPVKKVQTIIEEPKPLKQTAIPSEPPKPAAAPIQTPSLRQTMQTTKPVFRKTMETPPVAAKKEIELSQLSCLYIEDQVDSQILFKVQMKDLKEIKFGVSFEEALPLLSAYKFDFIVMDINLQGEYNGLDALKMIRQMPMFQMIPIIAVTAYVLPGDREKFIAAGFDDFISKPIFREKMIETLQKIFST